MRGSGTSPHSYVWTWQCGTSLGLRGWNPGNWDSQNPGEYPAGRHTVTWDGGDREGPGAAAGVYLCRMSAGEFRAQRTMVRLP